MAAKLKIKKGDKVVVIAGKDKGKQGEVIRVIPSENRAVVSGMNIAKRHTKQTAAQEGGIVSEGACRSTFRTWRCATPRTASRPAWATRRWPTARRSASPSVQERRSMAEEKKEAGGQARKPRCQGRKGPQEGRRERLACEKDANAGLPEIMCRACASTTMKS
jgi:bifunctional DNA-binding transcriptional regulator/antitoxin component of YhaV-PrlF toxin-antitoxin module